MRLLKNLTATSLASLTGMAMQALTAPLYLSILDVHTFSRWLFATSVGAYLSLTVNGLFYAIMNDVVIDSHNGNQRSANKLYQDGLYIILYLFVPLSVLAAIANIIFSHTAAAVLSITLATAAVNLTYVLIDANFRSQSKFVLGSNILSSMRVLDWLVGLGAVLLTKDIAQALALTLGYRICATLALLSTFQFTPGSLRLSKITRPPGTRSLVRYAARAKGQLAIAATGASSSMLPQIVASSVFPGHVSVYFNVYRTYMRLLASAATTANAAAWPILTRLYAERKRAELRRFFSIGLMLTFALAILGATVLFLGAHFAFPLLFKSKIEIIAPWMALTAVAVVISAMTIFCQSVFIATNMTSWTMYTNLGLTLGSMACLTVASQAWGIYGLLWTLVASEALMFWATLSSATKALNRWHLESVEP